MSRKFIKEHTLPSTETIYMDFEEGAGKPWIVGNYTEDNNIRWEVYFSTQEEAEKEYVRFD